MGQLGVLPRRLPNTTPTSAFVTLLVSAVFDKDCHCPVILAAISTSQGSSLKEGHDTSHPFSAAVASTTQSSQQRCGQLSR